MSFTNADIALIAEINGMIEQRIARVLAQAIKQSLPNVRLVDPANDFSPPLLQILRRAWVLAEGLRSRDVTIEHVVVAASKFDPSAPDRKIETELKSDADVLAAFAKIDPFSLKSGALVRAATLNIEVTQTPWEKLFPNTALQKWIGAANDRNPEGTALNFRNLIDALDDPDVEPNIRKGVKADLNEQVEVVDTQSQFVRMRQDVGNLGQDVRRLRKGADDLLARVNTLVSTAEAREAHLNIVIDDIHDSLPGTTSALEATGTAVSALHDSLATAHRTLGDALADHGGRTVASITGMHDTIHELKTLVSNRAVETQVIDLAPLMASVDAIKAAQYTAAADIAAIKDHLFAPPPPVAISIAPPSFARLAAMITGALLMGASAGWGIYAVARAQTPVPITVSSAAPQK